MSEFSASLPQAFPRRSRLMVLILAGMYAASVGILLWASVTPPPLPMWGGLVDVPLAFGLVVMAAVLHYRTTPRVDLAALRWSHHVITYLPALLFVGLWLYRDHLIWNVLLPGLAWRTYLLVQMLPTLIAAWRGVPAVEAAVPRQ